MGGRAAHQLPQSVLLSLHVPAEARPRLKARTSVRKSMPAWGATPNEFVRWPYGCR